MRPLAVDRLPEFKEERARVSAGSTIRVQHCSYSVPSRLIGRAVQVLRLRGAGSRSTSAAHLQLACERLRGRNRHRIDYRHVIWSLVRKPGAFARYVYREEMFPSLAFRRAYDAIIDARGRAPRRSRVPAHPPPRREHQRGGRRDRAGAAPRREAAE